MGRKVFPIHSLRSAGKKLRAIASHPEVCFSIVGDVNLQPSKFTTEYESAHIGLPPEERMQALVLLVEKLSPNDVETGKRYAERSFYRTEIIRLDIEEFSGKTKKIHRLSSKAAG